MVIVNSKKLLPMVVFASMMLSACSNHQSSQVQVVDQTRSYRNHVKTNTVPYAGGVRQQPATAVVVAQQGVSGTGKHVVQKGETLYSLAFSIGRDWRDLASDNNIASPYVIYPGQTIYLSGKAKTTTATTVNTTTHDSGGVKVTTTRPNVQTTSSKTTTATTAPVKDTPKPTTAVVGGWTWPALGKVIGTYSPSAALNKGIDISAAEGTPVMAASAGTVVYAGNNLHGYGNLLIIKHNESYVSAYGHNRSLLVKEGQKVSAGQKIAEMGSTGADKVKLHFEIRQNGRPVDPLKYLPKK